MNTLGVAGVLLFVVLGVVLILFEATRIVGKILLTIGLIFCLGIASLFVAVVIALTAPHSEFYPVVFLIGVAFVIALAVLPIWGLLKKRFVSIPVISGILICALTAGGFALYQRHIDSIPTVGENSELLFSYAPYGDGSMVALLDDEAKIKFEDNIPKMDGATALYPIYSAFARAVYPKELLYTSDDMQSIRNNEYLNCSTTTRAYEKIVTGDADIIFAAAPSEEQKQFAKSRGVELEFTPIRK